MDIITPKELQKKITSKDQFLLLDVRDPFEKYQSNIEANHYQNIQADQLETHLDEIEAEKDDEIICVCRAGGRCTGAHELLVQSGYTKVKTLKGGINNWSKEVDNSLPIY